MPTPPASPRREASVDEFTVAMQVRVPQTAPIWFDYIVDRKLLDAKVEPLFSGAQMLFTIVIVQLLEWKSGNDHETAYDLIRECLDKLVEEDRREEEKKLPRSDAIEDTLTAAKDEQEARQIGALAVQVRSQSKTSSRLWARFKRV